jgi:hypothetical protein
MARRVPSGQYDVGFGKPPEHGKIKPGERRRTRRATAKPKNPLLMLDAVLREKVTVMIEGEPRVMTKRKALLFSLRQKAAEGDSRAIKMTSELASSVAEPVGKPREINKPAFRAVIAHIIEERGIDPEAVRRRYLEMQTPNLTYEEAMQAQREQQDKMKREALGAWYDVK